MGSFECLSNYLVIEFYELMALFKTLILLLFCDFNSGRTGIVHEYEDCGLIECHVPQNLFKHDRMHLSGRILGNSVTEHVNYGCMPVFVPKSLFFGLRILLRICLSIRI